MDVKQILNLRTIYLTTDYPDLNANDPFLSLVCTLERAFETSHLQELIIFIRASVEEPETLTTSYDIWSLLDSALARPVFPDLRKVKIIFTNRPRGRDVRFVAEQMSELCDKGVLEVASGMDELWGKFLEVYKWKGGEKTTFVPVCAYQRLAQTNELMNRIDIIMRNIWLHEKP
jgi:hypothetical protein